MFAENFTPTSKDIGNGFQYRVYYPPISSIPSADTRYPQPPGNTALSAASIATAVSAFERNVGFVWDPQVGDDSQTGSTITPYIRKIRGKSMSTNNASSPLRTRPIVQGLRTTTLDLIALIQVA